jgi:2-polyprenyl-6-methoxyphenol hydroxylase-like FAD-dependent oxidoreductase
MTHALVIGAGMAGPVVATALQKGGVSATVFEAHDSPADTAGYFLNLASNGLDALHTVGVHIEDGLERHNIPRLRFVSGSGKYLGEVANGVRLPDGTVSTCVRRGVLQRALRHETARRGIPIQYGKRLVSIGTTAPGAVVAHFADATAPRAGSRSCPTSGPPPTISTSCSVAAPSSATWSATTVRSTGSPTSPTGTRPRHHGPRRSGATACWSCSPTTSP